MDRVWITNGSTTVAPIVNTLNAACLDGYLPTDIHLLENAGIDTVTEAAASQMKTIVTASGGDEPTVSRHAIDDELDFEAIATYLTSTIEEGEEADAEIAIDVTPGRRFWAIIAFQAGNQFDVDHLYYGHILSDEFYGTPYPNIPRTAMHLVDFTEVL